MNGRRIMRAAGLTALIAVAVACAGIAAAGDEPVRIDAIVNGYAAGSTFVSPRDIHCDIGNGEIYVADAGAHKVYIFDETGWPIYQFTHWVEVGGKTIAGEPSSIAVSPDGNIFVVDALTSAVHILDYRGRKLAMLEPVTVLPESAGDARAVAVEAGADGLIHVVAGRKGEYHVIAMESDGLVTRTVRLGRDEQLDHVTGMTVGTDGSYYVTDLSAEFAVQAFTANGVRFLKFGKHDVGMENFSYAADITIAANGDLWVVDMIRQFVGNFDGAGRFKTYLGGVGEGPGSMAYPCAAAIDGRGRVLVLEKVGRRFQTFVMPQGGAEDDSNQL